MTPASRRLVLQGVLFGAACGCLGVRAAYAAETPSPSGKYVCPPCGCAADGKEFDKPGACPECGMPLVPKPPASPTPPKARAEASGGFLAASDRAPSRDRKRATLG